MLELILSRENMLIALKRVERNKGSHGVDHMSVKSLREHIAENWQTIKHQIIKGAYIPATVRRVEIPKPNEGKRKLDIATVTDRLIQQAIAQILTQVYDSSNTHNSNGYRQKKREHDAVRQTRNYIKQGYRWVADIDLATFFDKVNHD